MATLAIHGGSKAVTEEPKDLFTWPIVTEEDEQAVLEVLRAGKMSGIDVTRRFEQELVQWHEKKYALGHCNGTQAIQAAMFGCRVGVGDEVICPSITYWASALSAFSLGATIVFADIDPKTLCIDPADVERHISNRTKAIIPVHYCGYPCDMDPIMAIAEEHGLKVIEDVSHAQGGLYKGRRLGTIGHVGAMSLMTGKSLACGEGGVFLTDDLEIFERAIAFGHYARTTSTTWTGDQQGLTLPELIPFKGLPLGGYKNRMNQLSAAMGRVQLRHYKDRIAEIQAAMNRFWDLLEELKGVKPHRPDKDSGSTMGGWYNARGLYVPEELNGLPVARFCEAVTAEGVPSVGPGCNFPLHLHPVLNEADVYGHGKPTRIANAACDVRQPKGSLPVSESILDHCLGVPWFKHDRPDYITQCASAFRKVIENAESL